MISAPSEADSALLKLEQKLQLVSAALREADAPALEAAVLQLQAELLRLAQRLNAPGRRGRVLPADLRQRLVQASAEVTAQREALARASATMNRAMQVLMPASPVAYGAQGADVRPTSTGSLLA